MNVSNRHDMEQEMEEEDDQYETGGKTFFTAKNFFLNFFVIMYYSIMWKMATFFSSLDPIEVLKMSAKSKWKFIYFICFAL